VKDGNADHITREPEMVKAFRDTWKDGIHSYLSYIRDRLTVDIVVDPSLDPSSVQVPVLLVQPLVENAIKYAVTPQENGAEINVVARLNGERVQITVSDSGPGLIETKSRPSLSTGVGLANIRDRLAQAYGPDHRFETRSNPGGGFGVEIDIPFQLEEPTKEAA
jgi:sensor histidine kinase YesM